MTKEALKLALETLEYAGPSWIDARQPAITAIKEALAQPEQEPLGFMNAGHVHEMQQGRLPYGYVYPKKESGTSVSVYTTPPQRKPLSDEEILTYRHMIDWTAEWSYINFARAIEAAHSIKGEA